MILKADQFLVAYFHTAAFYGLAMNHKHIVFSPKSACSFFLTVLMVENRCG